MLVSGIIWTKCSLLFVAMLAPCVLTQRSDLRDLRSGFLVLENRTFVDSVKSITKEDCDAVPDDWEPPFNVSRKFSYYLSGYDDDGRPIFIIEGGKMDLRSEVEAGQDRMDAIEKYALLCCHKAFQYMKKTEDYPDGELMAIVDADGFKMWQLYSPKTIIFAIRLGLMYRELAMRNGGGLIIINAPPISTMLLPYARSIAGDLMDRVEIYGSRKDRWLPVLLKKFPRDQLPPWYGGHKNFKPVKVFG